MFEMIGIGFVIVLAAAVVAQTIRLFRSEHRAVGLRWQVGDLRVALQKSISNHEVDRAVREILYNRDCVRAFEREKKLGFFGKLYNLTLKVLSALWRQLPDVDQRFCLRGIAAVPTQEKGKSYFFPQPRRIDTAIENIAILQRHIARLNGLDVSHQSDREERFVQEWQSRGDQRVAVIA